MKSVCVLLLALLMPFKSGVASEVDDPSALPKENVAEDVKKDLQSLSGKWKIYWLMISSVDDTFGNNLDKNYFEYKEISYDRGNLSVKSYETDSTEFEESRASFDGQKFVVKLNRRDQLFDVIAYKRQKYIALQPSSKSFMQKQNILGFIWVYEDETLEESTILDLKLKLNDYYVDARKQKSF